MVSVFLAFVINGDPTVKQFGLGMAVAVAVDATVVRCVLVPAIMALLGKAGWWFPGWLDRITPNFSIEGEEWFAERERKPAEEPSPQAEEPRMEAARQEALREDARSERSPENRDARNEQTKTD
jgi:putative drug exporter of the RND superfamily